MPNRTHDYLDLLIAMRSDRRGAEALNSLDIIDTKAGGIAGLIGGFSAAGFFILQQSIDQHIASPWFYFLSLGAASLLSVSGLLCAASLYIINHFQAFLFADLEGKSEQEKIDVAADRIVAIYQGRVQRYLWCLRFLFGGILLLAASAGAYFLPIGGSKPTSDPVACTLPPAAPADVYAQPTTEKGL